MAEIDPMDHRPPGSRSPASASVSASVENDRVRSHVCGVTERGSVGAACRDHVGDGRHDLSRPLRGLVPAEIQQLHEYPPACCSCVARRAARPADRSGTSRLCASSPSLTDGTARSTPSRQLYHRHRGSRTAAQPAAAASPQDTPPRALRTNSGMRPPRTGSHRGAGGCCATLTGPVQPPPSTAAIRRSPAHVRR